MSESYREKYSLVVVDELLKSNDWKSIQEVIYFTFQSIVDVVKCQENSLKELEKQISLTISKKDLQEAIAKKIEDGDLSEALNQMNKNISNNLNDINTKISEKLSVIDFQYAINQKISKEELDLSLQNSQNNYSRLCKQIEFLEKKDDNMLSQLEFLKTDIRSRIKSVELEGVLGQIKEESAKNTENIQGLYKKVMKNYNFSEKISKIEELCKNIESGLISTKSDYFSLKKYFCEELGKKCDIKAYEQNYEAFKQKLNFLEENLNKTKFETEKILEKTLKAEKKLYHQYTQSQKIQENIIFSHENLNKKILEFENFSESFGLSDINHKFSQIFIEIDKKVDRKIFNDSINQLESGYDKVNISDFNRTITFLQDTFECLKKDVVFKSGIKEIFSILERKANIDEVNTILTQIHSEIDEKLEKNEFIKELATQKKINLSLNSANFIGRWVWKSGGLLRNNFIPWEEETLNTCKDNYIWEESSGIITIIQSGYYHISLGLFTSKQPVVQIYINSEIVISAVNSPFTAQNNSGKLKNQSISGITLSEYINVPSKSRISIYHNSSGNGFLTLQKL